MGERVVKPLLFLLGLLFCSGAPVIESNEGSCSKSSPVLRLSSPKLQAAHEAKKLLAHQSRKRYQRMLFTGTEMESTQMDVITPVINPTTPTYNPLPTPSYPTTTTTTPVTDPDTTPTMSTPATGIPTMGTPSSAGQSWCVASQTASQTALQVALDYACGYGGADCSAIQPGGSCYNPDTIRDHASYAFNSYYQKNPIPTSCDFGGTATVTNIDPSTSQCQYPSTSIGSSVLNTTNPTPTGSTIFGSEPPADDSSTSVSIRIHLLFTLACFLLSLIYLKVYE